MINKFRYSLRFRQWGPPAAAAVRFHRALMAIFSSVGCFALACELVAIGGNRLWEHLGETLPHLNGQKKVDKGFG
jgi:hypothetical protein